MLRIKIYSIGKTKESWLQEALADYTNRLKQTLSIEWILVKDNDQLKQFLSKEATFICLDPSGKQYSSEEFSAYIMQLFREYHSRLCFVIGGAEGIPKELKAKGSALLSFSKMTFTHQMTRLILVEQLYRSLEIEKGSSYHK